MTPVPTLRCPRSVRRIPPQLGMRAAYSTIDGVSSFDLSRRRFIVGRRWNGLRHHALSRVRCA